MKKQLLLTLTVLCVSSLLNARETMVDQQAYEDNLKANGASDDVASEQADMAVKHAEQEADKNGDKKEKRFKKMKKSNVKRRIQNKSNNS